jgi:ABC-type Na+ efflux pump permease subunit
MLWKEAREFASNRRYLRIFGFTILIFGVLPALGHTDVQGPAGAAFILTLVRMLYSLFALVVVVAQTAPDLVLRERVGRTFDWLLATRLPDWAIFAGKVLTAAVVGYVSAILAFLVQTVVINLKSGAPWNWEYFALPDGRIVIFAISAVLAIYMAVIGTFVALRVAEQRSAYMVTMLGVLVLVAPFVLQWVTLALTPAWLWHAALVLAGADVILAALGIRFFRRDILVLTLYS